jgi:hypothetical protein
MTKRQRWQAFTLDDKVSMMHDVIVGKEKLADVSKRYHRSQGYISSLVKKLKKKRDLLQEMIEKRDQALEKK